MSATFHSSCGKTRAMVIRSMTAAESRYGDNFNASGRRCASTVFIMIVSGIILYPVYGVGARDPGERLASREKRRKRLERIKARFARGKPASPGARNRLPIRLCSNRRSL